jgi:hypothetical protein
MADDSKRVSELGITSTLSSNDRVLVLTNPDSSPNVQTITINNFAVKLANALPIANSTTPGVIKIGPGLSVAANGVVSAPLPVASNTVTGVVKIGAGINFDANGIISVAGFNYANTTDAGIIKVGQNLTINATGYLNAQVDTYTYANATTAGIVKVGNNLSVNATGFMNTPGTGSWTFDGTRANTGGSQNSWIDGQSPGGLWLHNDYTITLTASNNSANSTYGYGYFSNNESGLYNQLDSTSTWSWLGTNISDSEEPYVFIENTRNAGANNQITNRWIFDLHGNFSLPANSIVGSEGGFHIENATTISANAITIHNNIFDDLNRPLINVNALDINADGGTPATVFGPSDTVFDGGAGTTVFGLYEAALDGGVSFNNRHSASFIDGGGANQF